MGTKETKVVLSATTSKYERAMRDTKRITDKTTRSMNKSFKSVKSMMTGVMGKLVAIAGVAGMGLLAKRALETGDIIHKLNLRLGISTETLSKLEHISKLSGVAFKTTAKSIQKMQDHMAVQIKGVEIFFRHKETKHQMI